MKKSYPNDRNSIIQKILSEMKKRSPDVLDDSVEKFLAHYFAKVPLNDLAAIDIIDLCGAALCHWRLGTKRKKDQTCVNVYNPHFEKHGWQSTHTIVEIVTRDKPFLVDSVSIAINRAGLTTHLTIHPVFDVSRNAAGKITAIDDTSKQSSGESYMHFQIDRQTDGKILSDLKQSLLDVLDDVHRVTDDWRLMLDQAHALIDTIKSNGATRSVEESDSLVEFVEWLANDHFTFLGYCEFTQSGDGESPALVPVIDNMLGLLRGCDPDRLAGIIPYTNEAYEKSDWHMDVTKSDAASTAHRRSQMDLVTVQQFDQNGRRTGRVCFVGLFTSAVYNLSVHDVPLLRQKVAWVLKRSALEPNSHDNKALVNILESYPRDALFQSSNDEVLSISTGILQLQERQQIRLFGRSDQYNRFQTCMVYVPSERYGRELRLKIQDILMDAFNGTGVEFDTLFSSESILARIYYVIHTNPDQTHETDLALIEQRIVAAARSWQDNLCEALIDQFGEELGNTYFSQYQEAFSSGYKDHFSPRTACFDIQHIEAAQRSNSLETNFYRPLTHSENSVKFKLFAGETFIAPSDILPVLENMGLKVVAEHPYEVKPARRKPVWIHEFSLRHAGGKIIDPDAVGEKFQDAFARVWRGEIEDDGFNRLVLGANLGWRDTVMLRAYCKYLLQIRVPFSQAYMIDTLAANTGITTLLVKLFKGRFDPDNTLSEKAQAGLSTQIVGLLENVSNLDEDRILRGFLNVIKSTLRTNYFQLDSTGNYKPYLSFKLDPSKIKNMPLPRPMFEIFVASPRVEGVHLRGGRVARGGLRWSDRREDFRTEVLGLMKAQMVKNSVIVPVGSKGGFVVKQLPAGEDRETLMTEVVYCYKTFLRGLLDLTDNLIGSETVPPNQVVRYDSDDPYLVVAADKGTATFSDIANSVSDEYGFWLGDAFASGGSVGYDHKKMGITARGTWESVKRHFRELGVDIQSEDFSVMGIGDMGGDVFGNGMLLSQHIRLLGAFNHIHIFLDPDAGTTESFVERKRLFEMPRSSWDDYDRSLISKGGGIYKRSAKSIKLTPEVRAMLDVSDTSLTPNELIHVMLKAPVDLLWNGGIGTYVKSKSETDADVRDRANDAVRVNGAELRCKVVGEGGNLGFTQSGRIELARSGGILYTDAIDNSAGVDCSDHEVNIKILINAAVDAGDMTLKQRNKLLAELTDEVGEMVLDDNYYQTQAISIEHLRGPALLEEHARFMNTLESQGRLNRAIEYLPDAEEVAELMADKQGMTRPELSVLVSYSKMTMYDDLLDSELPDSSYLTARLVDYFPKPLRKKFHQQIQTHRLRREIISTVVTNEFVNRVGPTFAHRIHDQLGSHPADVCRAFIAGSVIFDMHQLWDEIESLDNKVFATTQTELLSLVNGLSERCIHWLLRNRRTGKGIKAMVDHFKQGVGELAQSMPGPLAEFNKNTLDLRTRYFTGANVPEDLANRVSMLVPFSSALDIVDIASVEKEKVAEVAEVFFTLGAVLDLAWLREQISLLDVGNHWHLLAKSGLRSDLHARQSNLAAEVLRTVKSADDPQQRVQSWLDTNSEGIEKYTRLMAEMKASKTTDFAMLSLAVNEVYSLQH